MTNDRIFPHLHLLVSGGNTQLLLCNSITDWKIVGATLDDAAGECFDKVSRMVGLPYPSGLYLAKIAKLEDRNYLNLPLTMQGRETLDFSFSGLKTATRLIVQKRQETIGDIQYMENLPEFEIQELITDKPQGALTTRQIFVCEVCVSAQSVIVFQLIQRLTLGIKNFNPVSIGVSGGVSANLLLRKKAQNLAIKNKIPLFKPSLELTGDNAIMIGLSGLAGLA